VKTLDTRSWPHLVGRAAGCLLLALTACGGVERDPPGPREPAAPRAAVPETTRRIHVSSAGDDNGDGLTPATALRTLPAAMALAHAAHAHEVLLRAGDVFELDEPVRLLVSGQSAARPFVLASYGAGRRPVLRSRGEVALLVGPDASAGPVEHVVVRGLALEEARSLEEIGSGVSEGLRVMAPEGASGTASDVSIEDVSVRGYGVGINALGGRTGTGIRDLRVRRTLILDTAHARNAIGMLFSRVEGLTLDEVVVDGVQRRDGASAGIFDHSVYVQTDCGDVSVRGSIFARAPDGVMQRAGGVLEDNLVVDVAIGALEGYVFAGATPTAGGVTFRAERNVFMDLGDLSPNLGRGVGMYVGNVRSGVIRDNVIARSRSATPWSGLALALMGETNEGNVGVRELTIQGTPIHGIPTPLRLAGRSFGRVRFARNVLGAPIGGTPFVSLDAAVTIAFERNRALSVTAPWMVAMGHSETPLSEWLSGRDTLAPATLIDETRDVAGYHASIGGEPSLEAFLAAVRAQSGDGWRDDLTGRAASAWIRAGLRARDP